MKVYIYARGGYKDIAVDTFTSLDEAKRAMQEDFEGMMRDNEENEYCFIDDMHAEICIPEDMYPEDAWGATISIAEIPPEAAEPESKWALVMKDPIYNEGGIICSGTRAEVLDRMHEAVLSYMKGYLDRSISSYQELCDAFMLLEDTDDWNDLEEGSLALDIADILFDMNKGNCDYEDSALVEDYALLPVGKYDGIFYEWDVQEI